MDLGLEDQVVLITGASRGLGYAAAEAFAGEGARLAICSHSADIERAAEAIRRKNDTPVLGMQTDLTRQEDIERFIAAAVEAYGVIDILVTNAGGPKPGGFLELQPGDWENAIRLKLMSVVHLCYAAVPRMLSQGRGSIVASESYAVKQPIENLVLSNSIRLAVVGLMKSLANELGPQGIRVNSIHPGWTSTERVVHLFEDRARRAGTTPQLEAEKIIQTVPLGRMATVEEYGRTVAWLASPAASFIHGHALFLDGGIVRAPL